MIFGAVLLAGFTFPVKSDSSSSSEPVDITSSQSTTKVVTGEGPWMASCKYWSAAQSAGPASKDKSQDLDVTLHLSGNDVDSHVKTAPVPESACGAGDGWGIPQGPEPEISSIVATIPDPIHSHLALDFDRSVDAILLAAADNGYLSSYYWLPWRSHVNSLSTNESACSPIPQKDEDNTREREPGLIILRYSPDVSEWETNKGRFSSASYHRVIYLFLVGETPALGVNGCVVADRHPQTGAVPGEADHDPGQHTRSSGIGQQLVCGRALPSRGPLPMSAGRPARAALQLPVQTRCTVSVCAAVAVS